MQPSDTNQSAGSSEIRLGSKVVGPGQPCYVIAEIEINHNGDIDIAKKPINVAVGAGCDAVKFQKRTVDLVYSPEELAPRESPFGETNGDLKRGHEFGGEEYREIDRYCREVKFDWFASCWGKKSVDCIARFTVPCFKIASASLTDDNLLCHTRAIGKDRSGQVETRQFCLTIERTQTVNKMLKRAGRFQACPLGGCDK